MTDLWGVCSISVVLPDTAYLLPHPGCRGEEKWNSCLFTRTSCNLPRFIVRVPNFILKTCTDYVLASSRGLTSHLCQRGGSWKAEFALPEICNFKNLLYPSFANPMSARKLLAVVFAANARAASFLWHANTSQNALWLLQAPHSFSLKPNGAKMAFPLISLVFKNR